MPKKLLPAILLTGLIAGTADIILAFISSYVQNNVTPDRVLRFVASGAFGRDGFTGGSNMIFMGLLFHFIIATAFAAILFFLFPKLKLASANWVVLGIIYGVLVWAIMNLLVLPLTNAPQIPLKLQNSLIGIGILIVAIGLPIVFFSTKFYSQKKLLKGSKMQESRSSSFG